MGLECGIVGLPNVGKSTLFNTLTNAEVPAENFPFCTVDPHRGVVPVPDPRLEELSAIVNPEKVVPTLMTFVDIAGLVKGASAGEGLGNQFLSHIREVHAIAHVVRCFRDENIIHVMGEPNPKRDIEIIDLELCLSDLDTIKKRLDKIERSAKAGNAEAKTEVEFIKIAMESLNEGISLRRIKSKLEGFPLDGFLTSKPVIYVANMAESEIKNPSAEAKTWLADVQKIADLDRALVIPMSVSLEQQLSQLSEDDRKVFQEEYGIKEPALHRFIREAYKALGLITFFTAGVKEVRAWTVRKGGLAPDAAGEIHTDFKKGFIRAETIAFSDYIAQKGEKGAKEKGLQRSEGKEYVVADGDVILFRFAV
ncbi:MAG: redox-regulated ATPase YchF [Deltaproteobacteria bacterium]|nr:redox-regulated ATPase YchF [Deltaproteobacteria bacterium]